MARRKSRPQRYDGPDPLRLANKQYREHCAQLAEWARLYFGTKRP